MTSMQIENIRISKELTLKELAALGIVITEHDAGMTQYSCGAIRNHPAPTPADQTKKERE